MNNEQKQQLKEEIIKVLVVALGTLLVSCGKVVISLSVKQNENVGECEIDRGKSQQ